MKLRALAAAALALFTLALSGGARAQTMFLSGDAGIALLGPPLVPVNQGAAVLTPRVGIGAEFRHFQVEFDVGVLTPFVFDEGLLVVPSLDASFMFRHPQASVRPYLGGGLDLVYVVSTDAGFAFPWAHLTAGIDTAISKRASFYGEVRTYGLETQLTVGSKFRF